eukprot:TRINITY_DN6220_c3_g1_i1.p1 TRINITY_DN6220_c3_g1~~TRINITY_DN6220_c3_g1_i1.p1  ORF type:complete len:360 (+),score=111.71 TRINITY_DN6220_c3_g1_i1:65-1144(+)
MAEAHGLTDTDVKQCFDLFDTDGSGKLSRQELKFAFKSMGLHYIQDSDVEELMLKVDKDKDRLIDFEEFTDMIKNKGHTTGSKEEARRVFDGFASSLHGEIRAQDLVEATRKIFGAPVSDAEIHDTIKWVKYGYQMDSGEAESSDHITWKEFEHAVTKYDPATREQRYAERQRRREEERKMERSQKRGKSPKGTPKHTPTHAPLSGSMASRGSAHKSGSGSQRAPPGGSGSQRAPPSGSGSQRAPIGSGSTREPPHPQTPEHRRSGSRRSGSARREGSVAGSSQQRMSPHSSPQRDRSSQRSQGSPQRERSSQRSRGSAKGSQRSSPKGSSSRKGTPASTGQKRTPPGSSNTSFQRHDR